jgi:hypothetical protein
MATLERMQRPLAARAITAVDTIVAGAAVGVLKQLAAGPLNLAQAATDQSLRAILRGAPEE